MRKNFYDEWLMLENNNMNGPRTNLCHVKPNIHKIFTNYYTFCEDFLNILLQMVFFMIKLILLLLAQQYLMILSHERSEYIGNMA